MQRRLNRHLFLSRSPVLLIASAVFLCSFAFLPITVHATYVKYTIFQSIGLLLILYLAAAKLRLLPHAWLGPRDWGRDGLLAAYFAAAFLLINLLSLLWSGFHKATSFRILELAFYIGWFILVAGFITSRRHIAFLGWTYVIAAVITAAGAFIAYHFRHRIQFIEPYQGRIGFPAGNPIFLAGYLLPPLFVCLFCAARWLMPKWFRADHTRPVIWKALPSALVAVFLLYAIYHTKSWSGGVGIVFAVVPILLFVGKRFKWLLALQFASAIALAALLCSAIWFKMDDDPLRWALLAAILIIIILLSAFSLSRKLLPFLAVPLLIVLFVAYLPRARPQFLQWYRAEVPRQPSKAVRFVLWRGMLPMIAERPLLGWGAGTFVCNYPIFALPEQFIANPPRTMALNAHNEPLQITAEVGLVGSVIAALLLFFIFRAAWKGLSADRLDAAATVGWGIFTGTVAMLVQELGSVGLRFWDYAPFVWTNLALLVALAPDRASLRTTTPGRPPIPMILRLLAFVLVLLPVGKVWHSVAFADLLSQKYRRDAGRAFEAAVAARGAGLQHDATSKLSLDHGLSGWARPSALTSASLGSLAQGYFQTCRDKNDLAIDKSFAADNLFRALFDKSLAFYSESKYKEAAAVIEELQLLAPNIADTRLALAQNYALAGNKPKAVANLAAYLQQDPSHPSARMQLSRLLRDLTPADAAAARDELLRIAKDFRRDSFDTHVVLASLLAIMGRRKSAAQELETAYSLGAVSPDLFENLVALWNDAGYPDRARLWAQQGLKLFPANQRLKQLLTPLTPSQ